MGYELVRELATLGSVVSPNRSELDLAQPDSIRAFIQRIRPTLIVNAGAYTAVDRAEADRDMCFAVNAQAPGVLAEESVRLGAALIHYSTDYVFDGENTAPYIETDTPAPLNVYGESKLAGERSIAQVGGAWLVLRTSWIYGLRGRNFLRTIIHLARDREELQVVDDQIGAPTWSRSVAAATAQLVSGLGVREVVTDRLRDLSGIYHLSAGGATSWLGFAQAILAHRPQRRAMRLRPIPTDEYPAAALRPRWSVLSNTRVNERFGIFLGSWESQLALAMSGDDFCDVAPTPI